MNRFKFQNRTLTSFDFRIGFGASIILMFVAWFDTAYNLSFYPSPYHEEFESLIKDIT
jgi:hypothetical protein